MLEAVSENASNGCFKKNLASNYLELLQNNYNARKL